MFSAFASLSWYGMIRYVDGSLLLLENPLMMWCQCQRGRSYANIPPNHSTSGSRKMVSRVFHISWKSIILGWFCNKEKIPFFHFSCVYVYNARSTDLCFAMWNISNSDFDVKSTGLNLVIEHGPILTFDDDAKTGGFQNPYNQNPYNHNPYGVGILIWSVGIWIASVGI